MSIIGGNFDDLVGGLRGQIGAPGSAEFPAREAITSADYLRASVQNRQPGTLDARTETLRTSLVADGSEGASGIIDLINTIPDYFVLTDGQNLTYMTGALNMGDSDTGQKSRIQNLRDAEQVGDAINLSQLQAETDRLVAASTQYGDRLDPNVLEVTGVHVMQADIDAGTRKVVNLGATDSESGPSDAVNREYVTSSFTLTDDFFQSLTQSDTNPRAATLNMGGHVITNLATANPDTEPNHLVNVLRFGESLSETGIVGLTEPAGLIRPWACLTTSARGPGEPPAGYLLCDGRQYSNTETEYAGLVAVLGDRFNYATDPATVFRVPDLRGRVICGMVDMAGAPTNGIITGSGWARFSGGNMNPGVDGPGITRTNEPYQVNLPGNVAPNPVSTETQLLGEQHLPSHTHTLTNAQWYNKDNTGMAHIPGNHPPATGSYTSWLDTPVTPNPQTSGAGSTAPHTNVQPTMSLVWIISLG